MKFSICVPTYNRAEIVGNTINSVLQQTYSDWELLIVDDGSVDNTQQVIEEFEDSRIKYFKKENGGKHTALNCGIENATGEYFIILDSDDIIEPNCLEKFAGYINNLGDMQGYAGIMGKCQLADGKIIGDLFDDRHRELTYLDFHYRTSKDYGDCCEAIRTELLKDYRYPIGEGYKFVPEQFIFDQIGLSYKLYCVNDVFETKEYRSDGITKNARNHLKKNAEGFLIDCFNKLTYVFPTDGNIPLKKRFRIWVKYWVLYKIVNSKEYKIQRIPFLGHIAKLASCLYKI